MTPESSCEMGIREIISVMRLSIGIAPAALLFFFGFRFVLYSEDGPNLDRFFRRRVEPRLPGYRLGNERFFDPRRRDRRYRHFTQAVGLVFLVLFLVYFGLVIVPMIPENLLAHLRS